MYNRYIRDDKGSFTRISQEEHRKAEPVKQASSQRQDSPPPHRTTPKQESSPPPRQDSAAKPGGKASPMSDGLTGILRHFLDRFHMDHVDTGDLLLLGLLFFLFREDTDEELLTALGLLLIL